MRRDNDGRLAEVKIKLIADYQFKESGKWLRQGICPECGKLELYTSAVKPLVVKCGRLNHCGFEATSRELYPDIFTNFNKRYVPTAKNPNATADAYLEMARGFDLVKIKGWYSQNKYWNPNADKGTATVRFDVDRENDVWFERFVETIVITQEGESKARNKNFHGLIRGRYWQAPGMSLDSGDTVWLVEGILDAIALIQNGIKTVALLSCNNWRYTDFKKHQGVKWVIAFDSDSAGKNYSTKLYSKLVDDGLSVACAQLPEKHKKLDWNDAAQKELLTKSDIEDYLYNGSLLVADSAIGKALIMYNKLGSSVFSVAFRNRTYWFEMDLDKYHKQLNDLLEREKDKTEEDVRDEAIKGAGVIREIADCSIEFLYYQCNVITDESWYYARIDFPHSGPSVKNTFTGPQISGSSDFKKRLISIAPGAFFTGNGPQLNYLMKSQTHNIKVVKTVDYIGYSKEFGAYIFTKHAVQKGKLIDINTDDYFNLDKESVKSLSRSINIEIGNARTYRSDWPMLVKKSFGIKGLIAAAMWFGIMFSEQIRQKHKSFPFLEIVGIAGSGKTTLIEALWCVYGRNNEEGFDPAKISAAGMARKMVQVSNLPVSLIEGDRNDSTSGSKKFDWEELKPLYNGKGVRVRGMKTSGNETYEPPFRAGIVISQNNSVDGSEAILSRILHIYFDREGHTSETKIAADELASLNTDDLSHFLVLAAQSETQTMDYFNKTMPEYEKRLFTMPGVKVHRIAKNHAQLMCLADSFAKVTGLSQSIIGEMHAEIREMAVERQESIGADHPIIQHFWEIYDYVGAEHLNHSAQKGRIAINLQEFINLASENKLQVPLLSDLRSHLKGSKSHKFVSSNQATRSTKIQLGKSKVLKCWIFEDGE